MLIDAALRRMAGRLSAMQLDRRLRDAFDTDTWRRWRDWIAGSMQALAAGQPRLAARPAARRHPARRGLAAHRAPDRADGGGGGPRRRRPISRQREDAHERLTADPADGRP